MSGPLVISAAAIVDGKGLRSSTGIAATWRDLDQDPVAGHVRFRPIFGSEFRGFRRLDILSRMLLIATEACGLPEFLPAEARAETALVLASATGSLAADLRFEQSLRTPKLIKPAVFPYTLPSTCLGEIAIRHRLRGPTICLSVSAGEEGQGLATAARLLDHGETRSAMVLLGDWVPGCPGYAPKTRAAALLLRAGDPDTPRWADIDTALDDPLTAIHDLLQ